jgi:hypothetical protein
MKPTLFSNFFTSSITIATLCTGLLASILLLATNSQAEETQNTSNSLLSELTVSATTQMIKEANPLITEILEQKESDLTALNIVKQGEMIAQDKQKTTPQKLFPETQKKIATNSSAKTQEPNKRNNIGPVIDFGGNTTSFGVGGSLGVSDSLSLRPSIIFSNTTLLGAPLSGTDFGVAATYDVKLDDQGKSVAYFGPKISFASASVSGPRGSGSLSGTEFGLLVGLDYGVSDSINIGASIGIPISSSISGSGIIDGQTVQVNGTASGGSTTFKISAGYRF